MKKLGFFLLLSFTGIQAQVSLITSGFTTNLTKKDLNFSGDRKLFCTGFNDRLTENYLVVSKNKIGAEHDELYIEKFTKEGEGYIKTFSEKMTHPHNKSLAFVNNRMMYSDVDKDGHAEFLYVIDEQENGQESPLVKSWGIIVYKDKAYKIYVDAAENFSQTHYTEGFDELPAKVRGEFLEFWNGLKHK